MLICPRCGVKNSEDTRTCVECGAVLLRGPSGTGQLPPKSLLVGRYVIVELVGSGGMAAVYKAKDLRIPEKVWAIKEMSDAGLQDPVERESAESAFRREAQMLASLKHLNLTMVTDFFTQDGRFYLVMEFVEGQTLEQIVQEVPPGNFVEEDMVMRWCVQLFDVLEYLHNRHPPVIFRDLKPSNVILNIEGKIKLIDFGIARFFTPGQSRDTQFRGTHGYAPPEQYGQRQTDARSDIYALGVTLHQLSTRYNPQASPFLLPKAGSLNPRLSQILELTIERATQVDPDLRFASIAEMRSFLLEGPNLRQSQHGELFVTLAPKSGQERLTTTMRSRFSNWMGAYRGHVSGASNPSTHPGTLSLSTTVLNFGYLKRESEATQHLQIGNEGQGLLHIRLHSNSHWVKVKQRVTLRGGRSTNVPVHVEAKRLEPGDHLARIRVTAAEAEEMVTVKVYVQGSGEPAMIDEVSIPLSVDPREKLGQVLTGCERAIGRLQDAIATRPDGSAKSFLLTGYGNFQGTLVIQRAIGAACADLKRESKGIGALAVLAAFVDLKKIAAQELTDKHLVQLLTWELYRGAAAPGYHPDLQRRIEQVMASQDSVPRDEEVVTRSHRESGAGTTTVRTPNVSVLGTGVGSIAEISHSTPREAIETTVTGQQQKLADPDRMIAELRRVVEEVTGNYPENKRFRRKRPFPLRIVFVLENVQDVQIVPLLRRATSIPSAVCILTADRRLYDEWAASSGGKYALSPTLAVDSVVELENASKILPDLWAELTHGLQVSTEDNEMLDVFLRNIVVRTQGETGGQVNELMSHIWREPTSPRGKAPKWSLRFPRPGTADKRMAYFQNRIARGNLWFMPDDLDVEEVERVKVGLYRLLQWLGECERAVPPIVSGREMKQVAETVLPLIVVSGTEQQSHNLTQAKRQKIVKGFLKWLQNHGYLRKRSERSYRFDINLSWTPPVE